MKTIARASLALALVGVGACGGAASSSPASSSPSQTSAASAPTAPAKSEPAPAPAPAASAPAAPPDPHVPLVDAIRKDAIACYAAGKKSNPTMTEGHVVLNVAARDGRASCVIPSEGAGLSSEVEACLATRLAREPIPAGETRLSIPLELDDGAVELSKEQPRSGAAGIESLETHGVDRAGIVVMKLMEQINECVLDGMAKKPGLVGFFYVHAKIDPRGNVACAVANRGNDIPEDVLTCATDKISKWHFPKPKHGSGSVTIPIKVGKKP
ncbi:AgmX/PglI C-terminal domain-containing protein [Pendulispora rubella]|uniref:AgmX/PglI C-terminal domain-containing protein n=1 Tax=Pendulispora rubella TaxID=2741070 RepID=A0ABZ2L2R1_9BACT